MIYVLSFNLFLFLFRLFYLLFYPLDLTPEEAQYWDWSRHLDLSYYSKPPLVAYVNFLTRELFGASELGVRITPMLLSFLLSVLTYLFMRSLFDHRSALIASTLPQFTTGFNMNSLLMTTDALLVFFWSLAVMVLFFAFERNSLYLWLLAGFLAGLAFLSKYPAVFLLPCALLFALFYRRSLLKSYRPYLSLLPALFLSLPVLYWNYRQDFVSFKHVSTLASKSAEVLNLQSFLEFLGGQLLLLSVFPFLLLPFAWFKGLREAKTGFFVLFSLPVFLFFALLSLFKKVEANWPGFGYFTALLLLSLQLSRSRLLLPTYLLALFLSLLLHFTPLLDLLGLGGLIPPRRDPTKIGIGWSQLGLVVSQMRKGEEKIVTPHYQISAELAFYVKGNPRTYCINLGRRMNQYDLWKKDYEGDVLFVDYRPIDFRVLSASDGIIESRSPLYGEGRKLGGFTFTG
ncbi:MAG: glycosyltransferase family 39 protein [Aquificaceae bacterium]